MVPYKTIPPDAITSVQSLDMSDHLVRVEALKALKRERGWKDADMARALERSQSQLRSWWRPVGHKDARSIGEKLARSIEEKLGLPRFSLDQRPGAALTANEPPPTSRGAVYITSTATNGVRLIPIVQWEWFLVAKAELDQAELSSPGQRTLESSTPSSPGARFIEVRDDSMSPVISSGDHLLIDPSVSAVAGDTVLICSPTGELFVRTYKPRTAVSFDAVPTNEYHAALSSTTDGVRVLGVMIEHRRYRRR